MSYKIRSGLLGGVLRHPISALSLNDSTFVSLAFLLLLSLPLFGCNRGDPIVVIQLNPKNPDIIYVATNDYIYKTRDGGQTWTNLSHGMSHSRVISMAIDPAYPATVYAGTKGMLSLRVMMAGSTGLRCVRD